MPGGRRGRGRHRRGRRAIAAGQAARAQADSSPAAAAATDGSGTPLERPGEPALSDDAAADGREPGRETPLKEEEREQSQPAEEQQTPPDGQDEPGTEETAEAGAGDGQTGPQSDHKPSSEQEDAEDRAAATEEEDERPVKRTTQWPAVPGAARLVPGRRPHAGESGVTG